MTFSELFSLYGIAALLSSVRKLHADLTEAKSRLAVIEAQSFDERLRAETRLDDKVERLLAKNGVMPSRASDDAIQSVVPKRRSTALRTRIDRAKQNELKYYNLTREQPSTPEEEKQFDSDSLIERAKLINLPTSRSN